MNIGVVEKAMIVSVAGAMETAGISVDVIGTMTVIMITTIGGIAIGAMDIGAAGPGGFGETAGASGFMTLTETSKRITVTSTEKTGIIRFPPHPKRLEAYVASHFRISETLSSFHICYLTASKPRCRKKARHRERVDNRKGSAQWAGVTLWMVSLE
jgi:hypothetical protein